MYYITKQVRNTAVREDASAVGSAAATIPVFSGRLGSWQFSLRRETFSSSELVRLYDKAAIGWSKTLNRLNMPSAYGGLLRNVFSVDALGSLDERPRVLECGIGTAELSCALGDALPGSYSLDAIDISPKMLEQARSRLRDRGIDARLRRADVRNLPYSNSVFDVVMIAHVLEHLVDPGEALQEVFRVLKPGGILVVCITRQSFSGMLIHLKWRTHRVTPSQVRKWFFESRFEDVRFLSPDSNGIFRHLSVACVGRKPLSYQTITH